ncbi:MAG: RNA methyltransferase [Alphaproteobacteria bacterium]|nr:RNA methyltransferase [Alphaproteobacteria bacterium]
MRKNISPAVILVRTQLAENIGTTSRAMLNCGLDDLRLVKPREDWLGSKALAASSGAESVLESAQVFETVEDAVADLNVVYAASARRRHMCKKVVLPERAALDFRGSIARNERCGVLFGPERAGLENEDVSIADVLIEIPLNPAHTSLNLAQAVLVIGYEWFKSGDETLELQFPMKGTAPASKKDLLNFFNHLERELDACGFLRLKEKRPKMVCNIRNMFDRAELTEQEIKTLHGIVKELTTYRNSKGEVCDPDYDKNGKRIISK